MAPAHTELQEGTKNLQFPPITVDNVTAIASKSYRNKHFAGKIHVFWAQAECGLILPSLSSWEVVTKEKCVTTGGYMCRYCRGFWKSARGGTRFLQILGRHRNSVAALQMVLDEPPQHLYERWSWWEAAPTDFASAVPTALELPRTNADKGGLELIHTVAKKHAQDALTQPMQQ